MHNTFTRLAATAGIALSALMAHSAHAQATIDQTKALAGNVTPGDTAGFPITISQPGSYKLTSNLYVPAGSSGIAITASDVSIDLNGFRISGPGSCTFDAQAICSNLSGNGITAVSGIRNLSVRSGTVAGFSNGIVLADGRLADITVTDNSFGVTVLEVAAGKRTSTRVDGLHASRNRFGFVTEQSPTNSGNPAVHISRSLFTMNDKGVSGQPGTVLTDSVVEFNKVGVWLADISRNRINENGTNTFSVTPF